MDARLPVHQDVMRILQKREARSLWVTGQQDKVIKQSHHTLVNRLVPSQVTHAGGFVPCPGLVAADTQMAAGELREPAVACYI